MDFQWFNRLKPKDDGRALALFETCSPSSLRGKLLVCRQEEYRNFKVFNTYPSFFRYQSSFLEVKRVFYEVILGEFAQKPHFDIDLSGESSPESPGESEIYQPHYLVQALILAISKTLSEMEVVLDIERDVLIFTSHGPSKKSYHVVIANYCHSGNLEAEAFYRRVVEKLAHPRVDAIDHAVYSSVQQFRMLGSQKYESNRPKIFRPTFEFDDRIYTHKLHEKPRNSEHHDYLVFEQSLVGNVSRCKTLRSLLPQLPAYDFSRSSLDLTEETVKTVLTMISSDFRFSSVQGGMILLKRIRPSFCIICQRQHEHENPFLTVSNNQVYFHCRRSSKQESLTIGTVSASYVPDSRNIEEDEIFDYDPVLNLGDFPEDIEELPLNQKFIPSSEPEISKPEVEISKPEVKISKPISPVMVQINPKIEPSDLKLVPPTIDKITEKRRKTAENKHKRDLEEAYRQTEKYIESCQKFDAERLERDKELAKEKRRQESDMRREKREQKSLEKR